MILGIAYYNMLTLIPLPKGLDSLKEMVLGEFRSKVLWILVGMFACQRKQINTPTHRMLQ